MKFDDEKTQEEKLVEEIAELKSRIRNTEYDLANMFKGNTMLSGKLKNSQKSLEEKSTLLRQLKSNPVSAEKLENLENNIAEKDTDELSQDQEDIIEKEIEKQLV